MSIMANQGQEYQPGYTVVPRNLPTRHRLQNQRPDQNQEREIIVVD